MGNSGCLSASGGAGDGTGTDNSWLDGLLSGVGDMFGGLGKALTQIGEGIAGLASNIINGLKAFFIMIVDGLVTLGNFIVDGLVTLGKFIVDGLVTLGNFIVNGLVTLGHFIVDGIVFVLNVLIDAVKSVAGMIWSLFKGSIDFIVSSFLFVVDFLGGLIKGIIDAFLDLFKLIFMPEDGFLDKQFGAMQKSIDSKININEYTGAFDSVKNATATRVGTPRSSVSWLGVPINIDFMQFVDAYKGEIAWVFRGIMFITLLIYNINNVYKLIRGGASMEEGSDD
ncbi:MAG: hypothetical protein RSC27_04770, partial [Bacilli bacterium]